MRTGSVVTPDREAQLRAEATCRRLDLSGSDAAFFMTVFQFARDEELSGNDTYRLWRKYVEDPAADLAVAAYLEGIGSTRKKMRPKL